MYILMNANESITAPRILLARHSESMYDGKVEKRNHFEMGAWTWLYGSLPRFTWGGGRRSAKGLRFTIHNPSQIQLAGNVFQAIRSDQRHKAR